MKANYSKAMKIELIYEGGKDDDPVDPGGRTNQGVIQREYSAYRRRKGLPNRDVFLMEDSERDEIYDVNYAQKVRFDELPPGVDLVMLDGAINSGPAQSIKWCQRALGITADGVIGLVTMQRIQDAPDQDALIAGIISRREAFLRALKTFDHFGNGWLKRTQTLEKTGQAWVLEEDGPEHRFVANGNKKARTVDAKPIPSTAPADATAAGGAVSTTISTVQTTLQPLSDSSHLIKQILLAVLVIGAIATIGGILYGMYVRRRTAALTDALDLASAGPAPSANDNLPPEVLSHYVDPSAQGGGTGNIAPGSVTQSGRVAGDTEEKKVA